MEVELINGIFLILYLSFDDNEGRIDVVDGEDISIHKFILHKIPNVFIFFVFLHGACSLRQQFLKLGKTHLQLMLFLQFFYIDLQGKIVNHFLLIQKFQFWIIRPLITLYLISIIVMICKFATPLLRTLTLCNYYAYNRPYNKNKVKVYDRREDIPPRVSTKKLNSMKVYEDQSEVQLAQSIKALNLKDFSIRVHHLLIQKEKSPIFWSTVQNEFMNRIEPTTDPVQIRSYSKVLYSLSKSKKATGNYETKISLVLPFASPQSFTAMVTAMSRIAPYSQEFGYIVEMLYYKRKSEFNAREVVSINYSLSNNGRLCDKNIIDYIDSFNAVETITMLRCYDKSEQMTKQILSKALVKLRAIQREFNALDISDIICIYLKYEYIPPQLEEMIHESYSILKRHINDICVEKIWTHLPTSVNKGYLKIKFVEEIITTIQILRKGRNMSEVIWKKMQPTFQDFENIELKLRLEKIY